MSDCRWSFSFPSGISVNAMYRPTETHGRKALTDAAKDWRREVIDTIALSRMAAPAPPLAIEILIHPPTRRRFDGDNIVKLCQDACAEALGFDDAQIVDWHIRKHPACSRPRIEVHLTQHQGGDARPDPSEPHHSGEIVGPPNPHIGVLDASGRSTPLDRDLARRVRAALARGRRR